MANRDGGVTIAIEDDTGIVEEVVDPSIVDEGSDDAAFDELKQQLEASKRRERDAIDQLAISTAAEQEQARRLQQVSQEANASGGRAQSLAAREAKTNLDSITSALSTEQSLVNQMQQSLAKAYADADFAAAAKLQTDLALSGAKIVNYQAGKTALEEEIKRGAPSNVDPGDAVRAKEDPNSFLARPWTQEDAEFFLSGNPALGVTGRSARTAAWIRMHPQFISDTGFRSKAIAAANQALKDGVPSDSPDFFRAIEEKTGLRQADTTDHSQGGVAPRGEGTPVTTTTKTSAAAATTDRSSDGGGNGGTPSRGTAVGGAPPSRSVPGAPPAGKKLVRLTEQEVQHALATFTPEVFGKDVKPLEMFARQKAQLIAEGKWFGGNGGQQ
jgi:hypothetical protein